MVVKMVPSTLKLSCTFITKVTEIQKEPKLSFQPTAASVLFCTTMISLTAQWDHVHGQTSLWKVSPLVNRTPQGSFKEERPLCVRAEKERLCWWAVAEVPEGNSWSRCYSGWGHFTVCLGFCFCFFGRVFFYLIDKKGGGGVDSRNPGKTDGILQIIPVP